MTLPTTWRTRDGRELLITDMHDSHLRNTILFLRRHCANGKGIADLAMLTLPEPHGDMAQLAFEQEIDQHADMSPREWLEGEETYRALTREALHRGLVIDADDSWPDEAAAMSRATLVTLKGFETL